MSLRFSCLVFSSGLDAAVGNASGGGDVQRGGNADGERQQDFRLKRTPRDAVLQPHSVQTLHDNEGLSLVLPNLVDGANVGMVERGRCPSLASEAFQRLRVLRHIVGQELQGDKSS